MLFDSLARRKKALLYGIIPLVIVITSVIWSAALLSVKTIYNGVSVDGIDVSHMDKAKANLFVNSKLNEFDDDKVNLVYNENSWSFSLNDILFTYLAEDAVENAYRVGHTGNLFARLFMIIDLKFHGINITPEDTFDSEKLYNILLSIKKQIDKDEKNASVIYKDGNIKVDKDASGVLLDVDKNMEMIENHIRKRNFVNISLIVEEKAPKVAYNDIKEITNVLSDFTTAFNSQDVNRTDNIKLACEKIQSTILFPQDIFSMSQTLGPRTIENGYKDAPVIFQNELIKGPGGGVCQVTTTLYDAVLKSKLEVIERTHHSMPLGYVQPGEDATIAEDYIDFKFQNNRSYPVCLSAEVKGNTLHISILGRKEKQDEGIVVKLKPYTVEEYVPTDEEVVIDDNVPDNTKQVVREAKKGLKVILYRETYSLNGDLIGREKISEDVYKPVKAQVKVNSKYNIIEKEGSVNGQ